MAGGGREVFECDWIREKFTCTSIHCMFGKVSLTSFGSFLLMSFYNCLFLCHCPHPNYILLGLLQWPLNSFQNWDSLTSRVFRKSDIFPLLLSLSDPFHCLFKPSAHWLPLSLLMSLVPASFCQELLVLWQVTVSCFDRNNKESVSFPLNNKTRASEEFL